MRSLDNLKEAARLAWPGLRDLSLKSRAVRRTIYLFSAVVIAGTIASFLGYEVSLVVFFIWLTMSVFSRSRGSLTVKATHSSCKSVNVKRYQRSYILKRAVAILAIGGLIGVGVLLFLCALV